MALLLHLAMSLPACLQSSMLKAPSCSPMEPALEPDTTRGSRLASSSALTMPCSTARTQQTAALPAHARSEAAQAQHQTNALMALPLR